MKVMGKIGTMRNVTELLFKLAHAVTQRTFTFFFVCYITFCLFNYSRWISLQESLKMCERIRQCYRSLHSLPQKVQPNILCVQIKKGLEKESFDLDCSRHRCNFQQFCICRVRANAMFESEQNWLVFLFSKRSALANFRRSISAFFFLFHSFREKDFSMFVCVAERACMFKWVWQRKMRNIDARLPPRRGAYWTQTFARGWFLHEK